MPSIVVSSFFIFNLRHLPAASAFPPAEGSLSHREGKSDLEGAELCPSSSNGLEIGQPVLVEALQFIVQSILVYLFSALLNHACHSYMREHLVLKCLPNIANPWVTVVLSATQFLTEKRHFIAGVGAVQSWLSLVAIYRAQREDQVAQLRPYNSLAKSYRELINRI